MGDGDVLYQDFFNYYYAYLQKLHFLGFEEYLLLNLSAKIFQVCLEKVLEDVLERLCKLWKCDCQIWQKFRWLMVEALGYPDLRKDDH